MRRVAHSFFTASVLSGIPLRVVSVQNRVNSFHESISSLPMSATRWQHVIATDSSDLVVNVNNWYAPTAAGTTGNGNAITILEMSIENVGGTVSIPVYFGGSRSITLADGATDIKSDPVSPSSFSLAKFSRTERYWIKTKVQVAAAGFIPYTAAASNTFAGQSVTWYDPATTTMSSVDTLGAFTSTGTAPSARTAGFRPMLLGHPITDGPSFLWTGDSIGEQVNDGTANNVYGQGFIQRAMTQSDGSLPIPCMNFCRNGAGYVTFTTGAHWIPYIKYAKYGGDEMGTNDIGTAGTGSLSFIQTSAQSIWSTMKANGASKIIRTKYMPRTNSTDAWVTEVNQTYFPGWGTGELSTQLNSFFDAQVTAGNINVTVPMATIRGVDPLKWLTNGTANYTIADGTHASTQGHIFAANELRTAIAFLG